LKQSATSIRRHIAIAKLPEEGRKAIEAGASAKKILAQKATAERKRRQQERILEDRETGAPSDELATMILEFCRAKGGGNRPARYGEPARRLLDETLTTLLRFGASPERVPPVSKKLGMKGLLKKTKPPLDEDVELMGYQAMWLARAILATAPEKPIWENAIEKAEKRIGELTPPRERPFASWGQIKYLDPQPPRPFFKGARSTKRPGGRKAS
jgi:hypothetical protein